MTALNYYTRSEGDTSWDSHARNAKVSPLLRLLCIAANDFAPDKDRERIIGPHLFDPCGTKNEMDEERAKLFKRWVAMNVNVQHTSHFAMMSEIDFRDMGFSDCEAQSLGRALYSVYSWIYHYGCNPIPDYKMKSLSEPGVYVYTTDFDLMQPIQYQCVDQRPIEWARRTEAFVNLIVELCKIGEKCEVVPTTTKEAVLAL